MAEILKVNKNENKIQSSHSLCAVSALCTYSAHVIAGSLTLMGLMVTLLTQFWYESAIFLSQTSVSD